MSNISLNNVQSTSFIQIINQIVNQFKVNISIYKLYTGIKRDIVNNINFSDPEKFRTTYVNTMFNTSKPLTSFELIITEIPEISHSQEWKRYLEGSETFTSLYSLISVISLIPGGEKWTSLIQRIHQRFFSPKYSTGMNPTSESISIKQLYDSRLFKLTEINDNIITVLTYLQYTTLNNSTVVTPSSLYDSIPKDSEKVKKHLLATQLHIIDSALYNMSSITVESLLKMESKLLENFLVGTKQLSIDNYVFTIDIPLLSYNSPFLVIKSISYSFNEVVYDNEYNKYIPKSVELQMSFEPFMPRYVKRDTSVFNITYNNRFYIVV